MNIDQRSIDTIRMLSAEAVEKAKSGHPGTALGSSANGLYIMVKGNGSQRQESDMV